MGEAECGGMMIYSESRRGCLTWQSRLYLLTAGCHMEKESCSEVAPPIRTVCVCLSLRGYLLLHYANQP